MPRTIIPRNRPDQRDFSDRRTPALCSTLSGVASQAPLASEGSADPAIGKGRSDWGAHVPERKNAHHSRYGLLMAKVIQHPGVLNSWKEIAAYLGHGIRTVQRWEVQLRLPVRRPRGRSRSAVIALKREIDSWRLVALATAGEKVAALGGIGNRTLLKSRTRQVTLNVAELDRRIRRMSELLNNIHAKLSGVERFEVESGKVTRRSEM